MSQLRITTLPETNIFAPENGWLEDDPFLLGRPIFRGYVSFREGIFGGQDLEVPCWNSIYFQTSSRLEIILQGPKRKPGELKRADETFCLPDHQNCSNLNGKQDDDDDDDDDCWNIPKLKFRVIINLYSWSAWDVWISKENSMRKPTTTKPSWWPTDWAPSTGPVGSIQMGSARKWRSWWSRRIREALWFYESGHTHTQNNKWDQNHTQILRRQMKCILCLHIMFAYQ